jgi:hypothetical protein
MVITVRPARLASALATDITTAITITTGATDTTITTADGGSSTTRPTASIA